MKNTKVLLTNSPAFNLGRFDKKHNKIKGYSLYPPVSITTLASSLIDEVDDIEVHILDLEYEILKYFNENDQSSFSALEIMKKILIDRLNDFKPDLVGISVLFSISHENSYVIANTVKRENPNTQVVFGGNHATFAYERMLKECQNTDYIFLYEADATFPLFIKYLQGKISFEELKGIAWMDKITNEAKLSPYAPTIENLDPLPIPKWDMVPIKNYQKFGRIGSVNSFGDENIPTYVIQTVRGCVAACCFCSVRGFYGKGVRAYSSNRVLEEIDYLYNELGIKQFEILDDDFTFDRERALEICNGLVNRNYDLVWNILNGIRVGTINDEVMDGLVSSGCRLISIGVESGNDTTLKIVRKPLSIKFLYKKAEIIQRYPELYVKANYIVGFPFENDEETMNTYNLAEDIGFDWNIFSIFKPLPGTPLFQQIDKEAQEDFDFDSVKNDFQFDALRNYQASETNNTHTNDESLFGVNISSDDEKIAELAYLKNLELNFIKNKNLNGRNVDRAIRDFKGIIKFIEKDHAIAHYCLAKAYSQKDDAEQAGYHMKKVIDMLDKSASHKWVEYFDKLVPKNEMNELKTLLTL